MLMIRRCRYLIPVAARRRPGDYGWQCVTNVPGAPVFHLPCSIAMPLTANPSKRKRCSRAAVASCMPMPMPGLMISIVLIRETGESTAG